ncbi:MAG: RNA polymerase sigma factor [Clostridiales bacterium]
MLEIESLYKKYFSRVYSFVINLSNNKSIAQEITQQTFFKALKKINTLDSNSNVFTWLCQIAKNTYIDYIRKEQRITSIENIDIINKKNNFEENYCQKENSLKIHKLLHNLKEPNKEVFMLRVFGELSYQEIATIFGKTEIWARVTYFRAKTKIQKELEDCNYE